MHRKLIALTALIASIMCTLVGVGCRSVAPRADTIEVAGKTYATTLDSDVARHYANADGRGSTTSGIDARIAALEARYMSSVPSREELAVIAAEFSRDFATLFYMRTMLRDEGSAHRQAYFARFLAEEASIPATSDLSVIFVPGWFYKDNGAETGSDFHRQLALFKNAGIDARLLEIGENASVEDNAAFVARALRALPRGDGRRYVVVSASKSGPEVAMALGSLSAEETVGIAAWVNIGGAVGGSPLADDAGAGLKCSFVKGILFAKGFTMDGLMSMKTEPRRAALLRAKIPKHIFVLNYVPAPMGADVTERGRDGYEAMKVLGPNDGLVLLSDAVIPGGSTVFEPGLDHFLVTDDIDLRTAALVAIVDQATRDPA